MGSDLPEVDHFFTPEDVPLIPDILARSAGAVLTPLELSVGTRVLTQLPHSAYLKIAEGCSNRCTYCTIPSIRGGFASLPEEQLVAEARELASRGTVELNIVAQDVTSYGADRSDPEALTRLLGRLSQVETIVWLRLLYAYPRVMPPGLVELLAQGGKVVPYLDVPIQHVHPRILRAMGRHGAAEEVEALLLDLRRRVPGLVLRTTAIVGFPGESDEEFQTLIDFVRHVRFHHLGAFLYSPEEGTPASKIRPRVSLKVARERLDHLLEVQAEISAERNREFLGKILDVLVEGVDEEGEVVGRTYGQAPEVDGFTRLRGWEGEVETGAFVQARIVDSSEYDLVGEVVGP
jgi:ribosomal protein S12 methylthiotransferase